MKDNFYYRLSLISSLVLFAFAFKHATETGIYNGLVLLAFAPLLLWFFAASIKDYVEYTRGERKKERDGNDE